MWVFFVSRTHNLRFAPVEGATHAHATRKLNRKGRTMMNEPNAGDSRRELLRRAGRTAAGAGVAALTGVLLIRNGDVAAAPACPRDGRCGCCGRAGTCELPAARALRAAPTRENDDA